MISQPKPQPKSAASNKHNANNAKDGAAKGPINKKRRGRSARPAKKTKEELDSEMADYFEAAPGGEAAPGTAPAPANGDAAMEDEIMVGFPHL